MTAHIHQGTAGVNGLLFIAVTFEPPSEGVQWLLRALILLYLKLLDFLVLEGYYINVHTKLRNKSPIAR
jgi:hypothetical protein